MTRERHLWVRGGHRQDRQRIVADLELPPLLVPVVDAHRRLRGPYTAAGTIVRHLAGQPDFTHSALSARHEIELFAVAPELREILLATKETLTTLAVPAERTRWPSVDQSLRFGRGLTEYFRDCASGVGPRTLVLENVEHADPSDAWLIAAMIRRVPADLLVLVVCTSAQDVPHAELRAELNGNVTLLDCSPGDRLEDPAGDPGELAAAYVASDCILDHPTVRAAYEGLPNADRAALHDQRARTLEVGGELSSRLGALPFHLEHGSDALGAGADALEFAVNHCVGLGFYDAGIELAERGLRLIGWDQPERRYRMLSRLGMSLLLLGRIDAAKALFDEARQCCADPLVHMKAAYMTAMIYTRFLRGEQRNEALGRAWINESIAMASLLSDPRERAFHTAFYKNGKALVGVNFGHMAEALREVDEAAALLDRELSPEEHRLHRSVLVYNRGQVYAGLKQFDLALRDITTVIELDPNYPEYYFERGNLLRQLGREDEAWDDYERVIQLAPPFPEVFYNRADILAGRGDVSGALAGYSYVLELAPDFIDALINRAGLLVELEDYHWARRDVMAGLEAEPNNAHLNSILGQLELTDGHADTARDAFDAAIAADETLQAAWAGRAEANFMLDDATQAVSDLSKAIELGDSPMLRFNRATALERLDRWTDALADLEQAAELDPDDTDILAERDRCRRTLETVGSP